MPTKAGQNGQNDTIDSQVQRNDAALTPEDAFSAGLEVAESGEIPADVAADIAAREAARKAEAAGDEDDQDEDQDEQATGADDKGKPSGKPAKQAGAGEDGDDPGSDDDQPQPDAATEKEIGTLGLKGKAAERFRALSADKAEMSPIREALTALGVTDFSQVPAQLAEMGKMAKFGQEWTQTIVSTGASDEQFGAVLGYLQAVNSNDPVLMQQAYDAMCKEQTWLAEKLGLPAPGADILDLDPALKERVKKGDIAREDAEELIRARTGKKQHEMHQEHLRKQREEEERRKAEVTPEQGVEKVKALAGELRKADPEHFKARLEAMTAGVVTIQKTLPPSKWEEAVKTLWDNTPAPKPAPKPKVGHQPIRGTGNNADHMARKPKDAADAFSMGVEAANNL